MGLRINTNSSAVTALRNLRNADRAQATSLERLSTGLRINRASDDPSGLVISEQLRAQIASLNQSLENTENASNLIGTAEAALNEVSRLLIGIRESALFALNSGGTSTEQISAEQDGVDSAISAIDRIASSTRFGKVQLLDGTSEIKVTGQSGEISNVNIRSINFDGFTSRTLDIDITTVATRANQATALAVADTVVSTGEVIFAISGENGTQTITLGSGATGQDLMDAVNLVALNTGVTMFDDGGDLTFRAINFGDDSFATVDQIGGTGGFASATLEFQNVRGVDVVGTIEGITATGDGNRLSINNFGLGVEIDMALSTTGTVAYSAGTTYTFTTVKSGLNFQLNTEANPNDAVRVGVGSVNSAFLGQQSITVDIGGGNTMTMGGLLTSLRAGSANDLFADPGNAVRIVDQAINEISDVRAYLGSLKSDILDSNQRSLGVAIENLTASESSIRDLDFAAETAEFTRTQILFQAGTAVLASANLIPQTILSLLQ